MEKTYNIVDLFCGVGGLTHGLKTEGFNVIAGIDFDNTCKYAFEKNNNSTFLHENLITMHSDSITELYPANSLKILVGCAPCQAFSTYSKNKGTNDKWKLLYSFSRIINDVKPDIISMENVPNLLKYDNGTVFRDFVANLRNLNYHVTYSVVSAQDYGVPQRRNRLVLFASKFADIQIIEPTHKDNYVTVRQAISHLPPVTDGVSHKNDILHRTRKLTPINKKRIMATPQGGGWHDWKPELLLECHKKASGRTFRDVYGRMRWDDVAPTLTTQCIGIGNGRFGHPEQDRAITMREAAILQSFPEDYEFYDPETPMSTVSVCRHIGNAVPARLGQVIAQSIKKHLEIYDNE
jgi:DNA (cytosine-5)-methyltransferase 1